MRGVSSLLHRPAADETTVLLPCVDRIIMGVEQLKHLEGKDKKDAVRIHAQPV